MESCYKDTTKRYLNPIIDWTTNDVWEFIEETKMSYCSLYDEGWRRIGCLFCPMASGKERFAMAAKYPGFTKAFRRAFRKLYQNRKKQGSKAVDRWSNGNEMFDWWLAGRVPKQNPDQMVIFE